MAGPSRDKTRSLALLLPLLGLFLLMPPAILAFSLPAAIAGLPIIVLYIFAVWGLLIIGSACLARFLRTSLDLQPPRSAPNHQTASSQDQTD